MPRRGLININELPRKFRDAVLAQAPIVPPKSATPRGMNKTEAAWERELKHEQERGRIRWFGFEAVTLKLAENRCRYTPDFCVVMADGRIEFHEVKGFWRDDARVKIKVAARLFPWARFVAVTRKGMGWETEEF